MEGSFISKVLSSYGLELPVLKSSSGDKEITRGYADGLSASCLGSPSSIHESNSQLGAETVDNVNGLGAFDGRLT